MLRAIIATITISLSTLVIAQPASAPRPAITGISHVTLYADDIAKSQRFYVDLLGWDQVPAAAAKPGVRFYANHAQYVELMSPPRAGLADRLESVAFSTTDAEALRKYLAAKGVAVPKAVTVDADGSRSFSGSRSRGKQGRIHPGWQAAATQARCSTAGRQLTHHACRLRRP